MCDDDILCRILSRREVSLLLYGQSEVLNTGVFVFAYRNGRGSRYTFLLIGSTSLYNSKKYNESMTINLATCGQKAKFVRLKLYTLNY